MAPSIDSLDLKVLAQAGYSVGRAGNSVSGSSGSDFSRVLADTGRISGGADYENYFKLAAETYQIPENLLKAVAKAESGFNPNAVSHCGAQGIMQLMPATARSLGVANSFDPGQNIMGGALYLRQMLDNFDGDVTKAVAAYNAGPGAVSKYGGIPPYKETQNYVRTVLGYAGEDIAVPPASVSADLGSVQEEGNPSEVTAEDLADLILRVYDSDSISPQQAAQVLVQQLLMQNEKESDDGQGELERLLRMYI